MSEISEISPPPEKVTTTILPRELAHSMGAELLDAINEPTERIVEAMRTFASDKARHKGESEQDLREKLNIFEESLRWMMTISRGLAEAQETRVVERNNIMEFEFSNTKTRPSILEALRSISPFARKPQIADQKLRYGLAHRINNYLGPIVGHSDILRQKTGLTQEERALMEAVYQASQEINERINLILVPEAKEQPLKETL